MASTILTCVRRQFSLNNVSKIIQNQRTDKKSYIFFIQRKWMCSYLFGKTVRIGCASGFWGDTATAVPQLVFGGKLDFLVFDYLSEITMSLLTAAKQKKPDMGYCPDFIHVAMAPFLHEIKQKGIRVISNAGGINPLSCAAALKEVAKNHGIELKIAVVTGDDLMSQKASIENGKVADMDSGALFPNTVSSMNAYLGGGPISRALDLGAEVVITGRCVDSALVLAPLLHTFKWSFDEVDKLAGGSLAGHLVECGAQVTGGIFTDWHMIEGWDSIGFPIVEADSTGNCIISKPPKTGGLVSIETVSEQLVYELGDPKNYVLPDVICDFSNVQLTQVKGYAGGAVFVHGSKGKIPSSDYKISATYSDGFRVIGVCVIAGPKSVQKAYKTIEAILKRTRKMFKHLSLDDYTKVHIEVLGSEQSYGSHARPECKETREAVIWFGAHHQQKMALELFARELASAGTGMAPGLTGIVDGRPRVSPVFKLFQFIYPKNQVCIQIHFEDKAAEVYSQPQTSTPKETDTSDHISEDSIEIKTGDRTYRLEDLALTRSGDKGNTANIGVIARDPAYWPYLKAALTPNAIKQYFKHLYEDDSKIDILRYELPGIHALNFVLPHALGGGGIASLRSDPQGKALAQMLLDFQLKNLPYIKV